MPNFKSFLRGFKKVGEFATNPMVGGLVAGFVPGAAPALTIAQKVMGAITAVEARHADTGREVTGPEKLAMVMGDFEDGLEATNALLEASHKRLAADPDKLKKAIDLQVAAFNAFADLKDSLKLVDLVEGPDGVWRPKP